MRAIFFLIGIALSLGGVLLLVSSAFVSSEPYHTLLTDMGSVFIGAGIVEFLFHVYAARLWIEELTNELLRKLNLPVTAFYETRDDVGPIATELHGIKELWVAWHAGTTLRLTGFFPDNCKGRAIIMKPTADLLLRHSQINEQQPAPDGFKGDIVHATNVLKSRGVEVRWFDGLIGNSMVIADPHEQNAWIRVDILTPLVPAVERPSFRVHKNRAPRLFGYFLKAYEQMWSKGELPYNLVS